MLCINCWAQPIASIEKSVGKLHISIDPRMELLSAVQTLSSYKVLNRQIPYNKDIQTYFNSFASHKAVSVTDELFNNQGFSYDAPVAFMLHLSQVPELIQQIQYSDYLLKRANNKDNLENYRVAIQQFAEETDFVKFWKSKEGFYAKIVDLTANEIAGIDLIKVIESYFNETQNSYSLLISPSFRGGYGPKIPSTNGKFDIYACVSTTNDKDGIPYLSKETLIYYVWHEFGHSFVNPETEKYSKRVDTWEQLFKPIREDMSRQAYRDLSTCINELIIRAINVRLQELNNGTAAAKNLLNQELSNRFVYIQPVINKLKEFEKQRDTKHITFSDFFPKLLDVLDSLQKTDYQKLAEYKFLGPINAVFNTQKTAIIYPTNDTDTASLKIAQNYAKQVYNLLKSRGRDIILISDSASLSKSLEEYGLMVYGTVASNLFLSQCKPAFPFKIENNTIYADKEYKDIDIRLITCLPNPQNKQKGMVIYTALSNKYIKDINNIFHGSTDFILSSNLRDIVGSGNYDKTDSWKFAK
jgi:hypothetical protein